METALAINNLNIKEEGEALTVSGGTKEITRAWDVSWGALPENKTIPRWEGQENFAVEAKIIGRELSKKIPKKQYEEICKEYSTLSDKMFAVGLTKEEEHRRIYLKWSKDRIEDAYYGASLDYLDELIAIKESIAEEIARFVSMTRK